METTHEELEKLRKSHKEKGRQENNFKDFKEKFDALKISEKKLTEEKNSLNDKLKTLKNDVT